MAECGSRSRDRSTTASTWAARSSSRRRRRSRPSAVPTISCGSSRPSTSRSWRSICSPSRFSTAVTSCSRSSRPSDAARFPRAVTCGSRRWGWWWWARCSSSSSPTIRGVWCRGSARSTGRRRGARLRRVPRERLGLAAGVIVLALILPAAARTQTELFYELKTVQSVKLTGVSGISSGTVRHVLKTRVPPWRRPWGEPSTLRLDFLRADTLAIRPVSPHSGFLDARSTFRVLAGKDDEHVAVVYDVVEGPRSYIRDVQLENVRRDLEGDIRRKLWARPDKPFDPGYMQLDSLVISGVYQDHGFRPLIAGVARTDANHQVRIGYRIDEGPRYRIGEVLAHGYQPVNRNLVMRELLLKTGDVERRDRVVRSQERLYETGLFSQVQFTAIPDTDGTTVDYEVRARARPPRWLEIGVGSSSSEKVKLNGSWGLKNLAGRG